ncbi:septal ring lytic transglycosylase RlpA family protein [Tessaracoccus sp. HDW20]|uniref:septal ring lytic transglycosylase RlpA family protein n=1 Tax=Tessaracoccus coleopterorum TaxID=2714950 RepID=UPI0018D2BF1B|nr:septal ring lytic transglycosylase RlpA family protein [Tessaracoccus coleopterorum]
MRAAGTVADVLAAQGIKPDADDKLAPAADTVLSDGLNISFVQVDVKTSTKAKVIPFEKSEVKSDKLEKGKTKVATKGVNGAATETYTDVYHDGVLVTSTLKSSVVDTEPVTQVTTVGTKVEATSTSSGGGSSLSPATGASCKASYYWQGQMTANGERFNPNDFTAAHKSYKFGTRVKVTNPKNGRSTIVRINDRGPYISGRCLDLSTAAMKAIGGTAAGVITVNYEVVG